MTVTLSQLIDQIRQELLVPRHASVPEEIYPFLFVQEVELELGVTVSSTVGGEGGVNIQVVELKSSAEKVNEQTHRITIKLTPILTVNEIREKLKQSDWVWDRVEAVSVKAILKGDSM